MTINERILEIIKSEHQLTQKGMAQYIGLSASTVSNWMKLGTSIPSDYLIPISEYLCISPMYLLTGNEKVRDLSSEDSEWLSLIHQLPDDAKKVFRKQLEGYLNAD